jgi:putative (di)nucleoside polyphosphate hydrolase
MIDSNGFRPNVGIIICNKLGQLLWAKRIKQDAWQFPQGGIKEAETTEEALFRELSEEVGLCKDDVRILSQTAEWLKYRLPKPYIRQRKGRTCIGQKQKWFLLGLQTEEGRVDLENTLQPEFDDWCWVNYWYPVNQVVDFKRSVYRKALIELEQSVKNFVNDNSALL